MLKVHVTDTRGRSWHWRMRTQDIQLATRTVYDLLGAFTKTISIDEVL